MFYKPLALLCLCTSVLAADKIGTVVVAADGKKYQLVKAERKLPGGVTQIAEYVLVGDKSGTHYAMGLTHKGSRPSFWKIK
jgi:hypothetical protein